tara:strand:- start:144 stop:626 length:483 start_codon:yes stop_codon:yes gene_type:complete
MWMQTVNRSDVEKVWVNFTNSDGATVTIHYPVVKFHGSGTAASIVTNEAATNPAIFNGGEKGGGGGCTIGIAYEDVVNNDVGICQVYGYHESAVLAKVGAGALTIRAGYGMAANDTTVGFNTLGADSFGPVIAMQTISNRMLSGAVAGIEYVNHVFIRAL